MPPYWLRKLVLVVTSLPIRLQNLLIMVRVTLLEAMSQQLVVVVVVFLLT